MEESTQSTQSAQPRINTGFLTSLRVVGIIEGISSLVLFFVAMPLKYGWDMPEAVTIAGGIHGFLFVLLAVMLLIGWKIIPLTGKLTFWGLVGAVPPFGPFVVEYWLHKLAKSASDAENGAE